MGNQQVEPTWSDVVQASAENDVEERKGTLRLPVKLTDHELAECGKRYADGVERLRRHDEETKAALKALKVERAAERDKIAEPNDELGAMVRSGAEIRDVPVTFLRSFSQNRKWVVRNDTGEELKEDGYAAEPLTSKDRQQMLLSDEDMGVSADDDGAEITDPAALLDDANDDGEA